MKRVFWLLIAGFLFGSLLPLADAQASSKGVVLSASEVDYPPFCIVSKNGKADGFSVELLRASLAAVDQDVEFKTGLWDEIKNDLTAGAVEVLPLVARSPEREALYDFTFPYLTLHGAVFVRKGDTRVKNVTDLQDKIVAVMRGDSAEEFARRTHISSRIVAVENYVQAMQILSEGKVDAVIAQRLMGLQLLNAMKLKTVAPLDFVLHDFQQNFCFAVRKGNAVLLSRLNEGLSIVIADGTFDRLNKKWFGPLLHGPIAFKDVGMYVVGILIPLIALISLLMVFILRREVRRKVASLVRVMEERKRLEGDVREQEDLARTYLQIAGVMMCVLDQSGKVILINKKGLDILGYDNEKELLGRNWFDIILPKEVVPGVREVFDHLVAGNIALVEYYENTVLTKSGQERMVAFHNTALRDKDGQIAGVLFSGEDITERKQMEGALQKMQSLLNETGKTAKVGGWEIDLERQELMWTEAVYRIHEVDEGFRPTVDRAIDFYAPSSKPIIAQAVLRAIEHGESFDLELEVITAKGNRLWVHAIGQAEQENGRAKKVFGTFQDITERKRAEEALRKSEVQLIEAQQVAKIGSWETDLLTMNVTWSTQVYRIFEVVPGSFEVSHAAFLAFVHPDDRVKVDAVFLGSVGRCSLNAIEHRIVTPGGVVKNVEERWHVFCDDQGRAVRAVGTCQDITERKRLEESLYEQMDLAQTYFQIAGVMLGVLDQSGAITRINKKGVDILGYNDEAELLGRNWFEVVLPKEMVSQVKGVFGQLMAGNIAPVEYYENGVLTKSGQERMIAFHNTVLRGDEGKITGALFSGEDITDRRRGG